MKKIILFVAVVSAFGCASAPDAPLANLISARGMDNFSADNAACEKKASAHERNLWLMGIESTDIPGMTKNAYNMCMQRKGYTGGDIKPG